MGDMIQGVGSINQPSTLASLPQPLIASGQGYVARPSTRWAIPADQLPAAAIIYTLTLTGDADGLDDIVIPMSLFQTRLNAGGIHYLSASIPNSLVWADKIAARPSGQWVVHKGYRYRLGSGEYQDVLAEIVRVDYSSLSWTRGSSGDSATITGNSTVAVLASKTVDVTGVQYAALDTDGKRRIRCEMSLWLAPGDLCRWFNGQMVAGEITHRVDDTAAWMEVVEA